MKVEKKGLAVLFFRGFTKLNAEVIFGGVRRFVGILLGVWEMKTGASLLLCDV